jgi:SAM-dependent methyltransferase
VRICDSYEAWATTYELFEGRTSVDTWRAGIIPEVAARARAGCSLLDLGAGTGIGETELRRAVPDLQVTSLERSANMIAAGSFAGTVVQADMTNFALDRKFDFIVSGFDALNYVPWSSLGDVFVSVRCHLTAGGYVIFDYSSPKVFREDWASIDYISQSDAGELARSHRWDDTTQRSETTLRLTQHGNVLWEERHVQYAVDAYDMYRLVSTRGFEVFLVRNIDATIFTPSSTTHVWVLTAK